MEVLTKLAIKQGWRKAIEIEPTLSPQEVGLMEGPEKEGETGDLPVHTGRADRVVSIQRPQPGHVAYLQSEPISH